LAGAGWSGRQIAEKLNAQGVMAPGAVWKRDPSVKNRKRNDGKWMCSAIVGNPKRGSGVLNNPIYKGDVVWGRSRWVRSPRDSAIRKCEVVSDADALVNYHEERLRIVSDDLWDRVFATQCARTPRAEAISKARRRGGRGPVYWLSSILVCADCGSNYVQYGRTDYVCSGYYNGGSCSNRARFRIADAVRSVVDALKIDFLSEENLAKAAEIASTHFEQMQRASTETDTPEISRSLVELAARESDVREQFKAGKLPVAVFKTWLSELENERKSIRKPAAAKRIPQEFSREAFIRAFRKSVTRRLEVFTSRVNVAKARDALRDLLSDGRLVMRADLENQRFEGSLILNQHELFEENQIDIKVVAGAGF